MGRGQTRTCSMASTLPAWQVPTKVRPKATAAKLDTSIVTSVSTTSGVSRSAICTAATNSHQCMGFLLDSHLMAV